MIRFVRFSAVALAVALAAGACNGGTATPSAGATPSGSNSPSLAPTDAETASPTISATPTSTPTPTPAPTGTPVPAHWAAAGNLPGANANWSQTHVLPVASGKILVVGDDNFAAPGPPSAVGAVIWDPGTGKWTATGNLNAPREYFAAESHYGQAIVFGGEDDTYTAYSSAKLYDPATGKWTATGLLATARMNLTSTRLKDGRVMAIGGEYVSGSTDKILASVEIYDPGTGKWTVTGSLTTARRNATAATLADGRVLVVGGDGGTPTTFSGGEIWDPGTGKWTATGKLTVTRTEFALLALPDGSALVAGGLDTSTVPAVAVASTEKLDVATLKWKPATAMKSAAANRIVATLADGKILLAGGRTGAHKPGIAGAEIYDPLAGTFTATAAMPTTQERSGAVLLGDGSVMVAGGDGGFTGPGSTPWIPEARLGALRYYPAKP